MQGEARMCGRAKEKDRQLAREKERSWKDARVVGQGEGIVAQGKGTERKEKGKEQEKRKENETMQEMQKRAVSKGCVRASGIEKKEEWKEREIQAKKRKWNKRKNCVEGRAEERRKRSDRPHPSRHKVDQLPLQGNVHRRQK